MSNTISVGIDVSKGALMVACAKDNKQYITREFTNSKSGILKVSSFLKTQGTADAVPCIIESTGDLHLLSSFMLSQRGFAVKCINPLITKQYQRYSVRNAKCDSIDAERLAFIGLQEPELPRFTATKDQIETRKMISSCAILENTLQRLKMHVTHLNRPDMGISINTSTLLKAMSLIEKQIKCLKKTMVEKSSDIANNMSMKGLTKEKMSVIDAFLCGRSFDNRDKLVAFAGLDVCSRRSGAWRGKERLSKRGNSYLRKTLYHIAWGLSRYEPMYKKYYESLRSRHLHYTTCLIAVARKFLRFVYSRYYGQLNLSTV